MSNPPVIRLSTPRAAPVAGIAFAVLFTISLVLLRSAIPPGLTTETNWLVEYDERIQVALLLTPFASIAFLWFIGVIRDQLGDHEDRFFATVFFGSSLLFLAMVFMAMSIIGGLAASTRLAGPEALDVGSVIFGRAIMLQISNIYALRMAGVAMISLGTIWLRTGTMPRWLAVLTYGLALLLLIVVNLSLWVTLVFPAWVFFISVYLLVRRPGRLGASEP